MYNTCTMRVGLNKSSVLPTKIESPAVCSVSIMRETLDMGYQRGWKTRSAQKDVNQLQFHVVVKPFADLFVKAGSEV